jgi:hypothetical protein
MVESHMYFMWPQMLIPSLYELCRAAVRTTGRILLMRGNLAAADCRDTDSCYSRNPLCAVEWATLACMDNLHALISGVSFTTSRTSSSTSGVIHLGQSLMVITGAKFPFSLRRQWILTSIFPSGHLCPGYLSWYKQYATMPPRIAARQMVHTMLYCMMLSLKNIQRETHLLRVAAMSVQLMPAGSQHLGNLGNRLSLVAEFDTSPSLTDTRQQFN